MSAAAPITGVPRPVAPGAEMAKLARFYRDATWTGHIVEGGMGPGSPPMTAVGRGVHHRIHDGVWIVGDYEQDQFLLDGTFVLRWQLHWVTGWDPDAGEYRAAVADNYGHADVMRGYVDGDRLVYESIGDRPVRVRVVWDASQPPALTWTNHVSVAGGPWSLVEQYELKTA